eukprot:scaffold1062_cov130-Cylindrotheca_fusiformis.AAC.12
MVEILPDGILTVKHSSAPGATFAANDDALLSITSSAKHINTVISHTSRLCLIMVGEFQLVVLAAEVATTAGLTTRAKKGAKKGVPHVASTIGSLAHVPLLPEPNMTWLYTKMYKDD